MSIVAAFDRVLFCNPASKYCVLQLKTADLIILEDARNPYTFGDHLIRFTAVGYDLPRIPGFGFKRVDAIVQKSGGDLHDPMRVQGALFYTLERSRTENGHLYLEAEALVKPALSLLNEKIPQLDLRLNRQQVEQELKAMIMDNVVVANKGNIYLPHMFTQESETACKVVHMFLEVPEPVKLVPVMKQIRGRLGIQLSPKQYEGVEMVFRHNLSIITGGPGTGKASRYMAETTGMDSA